MTGSKVETPRFANAQTDGRSGCVVDRAPLTSTADDARQPTVLNVRQSATERRAVIRHVSSHSAALRNRR